MCVCVCKCICQLATQTKKVVKYQCRINCLELITRKNKEQFPALAEHFFFKQFILLSI